MLLQRNLIYAGITRGKKLVVLIGQRKALRIAVLNNKTQRRYSGLLEALKVMPHEVLPKLRLLHGAGKPKGRGIPCMV